MSKTAFKKSEGNNLIAVIGDEDTVTGFLLAGVGDTDPRKNRGQNFFVVSKTTPLQDIETEFRRYVHRSDIGVILICQHIANDIRHVIAEHTNPLPCVLEIPSKDLPYDSEKDVVLQKVNRSLGLK
mmetsp:Transcript_55020/g.63284  ORF Transcript_55020/g.63284 Transcript_55020/m.63284 type:complete len:126 (-) Transcript_55020:88-465(-)